MTHILPRLLDEFMRRHPSLMLGAVIIGVIFVVLMFIVQAGNVIVLYEGF